MKRILAMIAVIMLLASSAYAEWFARLLGVGNDYMNAGLVVEAHPEELNIGRIWYYEDDKCIVINGEGGAPVLLDVSDGSITELEALDEDSELWRELIQQTPARQMFGITDDQLEGLISEKGVHNVYFDFTRSGHTIYGMEKAGSYLLLDTSMYRFFIDTANAVIRPAPYDHVLESGTCISIDKVNKTLNFVAPDGVITEVAISADAGYDWCLSGVEFRYKSAVALLREEKFDVNEPQAYSAAFIDDIAGGAAGDVAYIGEFGALTGPDMAILCGNDRALVYSMSRMLINPVYMACRDGSVYALVWKDGKVCALDPAETKDEDSFPVIPEGCSPLMPLGASENGKYAAFVEISDNQDVVIVDLDTMETHCLISGYEVYENAGNSPLVTMRPGSWDGSDYINAMIDYRLVFVFD